MGIAGLKVNPTNGIIMDGFYFSNCSGTQNISLHIFWRGRSKKIELEHLNFPSAKRVGVGLMI